MDGEDTEVFSRLLVSPNIYGADVDRPSISESVLAHVGVGPLSLPVSLKTEDTPRPGTTTHNTVE